jgi:hypothetical protein
VQLTVHRAGTRPPFTSDLPQAAAGQNHCLDRFRLLGWDLVQQSKGHGAASIVMTVLVLIGGWNLGPFV